MPKDKNREPNPAMVELSKRLIAGKEKKLGIGDAVTRKETSPKKSRFETFVFEHPFDSANLMSMQAFGDALSQKVGDRKILFAERMVGTRAGSVRFFLITERTSNA